MTKTEMKQEKSTAIIAEVHVNAHFIHMHLHMHMHMLPKQI